MEFADDNAKQAATATLERVGADSDHTAANADVRGVAAHIIRFSDPTYVAAFRKFARDPETFVADLTPDEARVWRAAREEARTTLATSGAVLPTQLDPTLVVLNAGVEGSMRSVARVDVTSANSKRFVTSAGSTFSFDVELAEVSDDTHAEVEVELTPEKAQGFIQASIEVWADQPDFASQVLQIITDGKTRLEEGKFVNGAGSGSNEPQGLVTALTGGASEVDALGETIDPDDVYGLIEALPARYRPNARWLLELSTRNFVHRLSSPTGDEPPLVEGSNLVGTPYVLNSSVDAFSDVDAAANGTHRPLIVGAMDHFVICDRIGTSVHFLPPGVLQNTNANRPDGSVGWYVYWRTTSKVLGIDPFRMLKITTAA
jgi:HK97 family phage major capsid protein